MNLKEDLIAYGKEMDEIADSVECGSNQLKDLINNMENAQLVIPVVGDFSAGKSSFINNFLGVNLLSVAVQPETALATELHYAPRDYIWAMKNDTEYDEYPIEQLQSISGDYQYLKVFLNNMNLAKIEPLVLVDMPGFDSPRDDHKKAIISYLSKGCHYIVLTAANAGTITNSMKRQITDIRNFGHSMSFFVSKANLMPESQLASVIAEIKDKLECDLDIAAEPLPIGKNDGNLLEKVIKGLNPNQLFSDTFLKMLQDAAYQLECSINTKLSGVNMSEDDYNEKVDQLKRAVSKLKSSQEELLRQNNSERFSEEDSVIDKVGRALNTNMENFVNIGLNNGGEALQNEMDSVVRNILTSEIPSAITAFNESIASKYANVIKSALSTPILDSITNSGFLETLQGQTQGLVNSIVTKNNQSNQNAEKAVQDVSSVLSGGGLLATSGLTGIAGFIVTGVLLVLPSIIGGIMKAVKQKQAEQQLRSSLSSAIVSVKSQIRPKIHELFASQKESSVTNIGDTMAEAIAQKEQELKAAQEEIAKGKEKVAAYVAKLNEAKEKLNAIKEKLYS